MTTASLKVISLNILGSHSRAPHAWEQRCPLLTTMWARLAPDIVGIQEGRAHQIADILSALPDYDCIGLSRSHPHDEGDEQSAIFVRRGRFETLKSGHFWLSDTPAVPASRSWGNTLPRMVTWVQLQEEASGAQFMVFNTHFDHISEEARRRSAELLRARIEECAGSESQLAIIVTGDFNARAPLAASTSGDAAYQILTSSHDAGRGLRDALWLSPQSGSVRGTFHGFSGHAQDRIDWILFNSVPQLESARVLDDEAESHELSDHFGVFATFSLSQG